MDDLELEEYIQRTAEEDQRAHEILEEAFKALPEESLVCPECGRPFLSWDATGTRQLLVWSFICSQGHRW